MPADDSDDSGSVLDSLMTSPTDPSQRLPAWLVAADSGILSGSLLSSWADMDLGKSFDPPDAITPPAKPAPAPAPVPALVHAAAPAPESMIRHVTRVIPKAVVDLGTASTPPPASMARSEEWQVVEHQVPHNPNDPDDVRTYRFEIKNRSNAFARECRVEFALPPDAGTVQSTHAAQRSPRGLKWHLGRIEPGVPIIIGVRIPMTRHTEYFRNQPATVRVAQGPLALPRLSVVCEAPESVRMGQPVQVRILVTNRGESDAKGLRIAAYCNNAEAVRVPDVLDVIRIGHTQVIDLQFPPMPAGHTRWQVAVTTPNVPPVYTTVEYVVIAPKYEITLEAPESIALDTEAMCRVVVKNLGNGPEHNARVSLKVPHHLIVSTVDQDGQLAESGDQVDWTIGTLERSGQWEATIRAVGFAPGSMTFEGILDTDVGQQFRTVATMTCAVVATADRKTLGQLETGVEWEAPAADIIRQSLPQRDARERHLMFGLGASRFALPIRNVREVLRLVPVTPVPGVPQWVSGVANIRGDIITVVDLTSCLNLRGADAKPSGLVVLNGDGEFADCQLAVAVHEVAGIRPMDAVTRPAEYDLGSMLTRTGEDRGQLVHELNTAELIRTIETRIN